MRWSFLTLAASLMIALGCYTTTYYNFQPEPQSTPSHTGAEPYVAQDWHSYWLFGWRPPEVRINAAAWCGGIENVKRLETERTSVQGLVASLAWYYVNVYSPYSIRVVCDHSPPR